MDDYKVTIKETLERTITVPAETLEEAKDIVKSEYRNQQHILDSSDFTGVTFTVKRA